MHENIIPRKTSQSQIALYTVEVYFHGVAGLVISTVIVGRMVGFLFCRYWVSVWEEENRHDR